MRTNRVLRGGLVAAFAISSLLAACGKDDKKDKEAKPTGASPPAPAADKAPVAKASGASGALAYLPASCSVAVHVDLVALSAVPSVKAHILPAVKASVERAAKDKEDFGAFLQETGLDPLTAFHDVAVCVGPFGSPPGEPKAMVASTGKIPAGIMDVIAKNSSKMDAEKLSDFKGFRVMRDEDAVMAQAKDGALMGGNSYELFEQASSAPNAFGADFAAAGNAAVRTVVPEATVKMGLTMPGSPFAAFGDKVAGASFFTVDLAGNRASLRIATVDDKAANELVGVARVLLSQLPKDKAGPEAMVIAALGAAEVTTDGKHFVMNIPLPAEQLNGLMQMVAMSMLGGGK